MKIRLEMELNIKGYGEESGDVKSDERVKEELTQMLFEVCEEWVLRGQQPDLKFIK